MANDSVWPTAGLRNILISGNNLQQFTASGAIKAGMAVAYNATGVSNTVEAANSGTSATFVGIALFDAADGTQVTVACRGCVAYGVNGKDNASIDAGDPLKLTTASGTVIPCLLSGGVVPTPILGYAIEDAANYVSGAYFAIDIAPGYLTPAA